MKDVEVVRVRPMRDGLVGVLIAGTVMILEPVKSAASNWSELSIGFGSLIFELAGPGLAAGVGLGAIGALAERLAPRRGTALLVSVYALLWVQASLFGWDYGRFDGTAIDWSRNAVGGMLEIGVGLVVLGFAILRPLRIQSNALRSTALIAVLQLAALVDALVTHGPFPAKSSVPPIAGLSRTLSSFSSDRNVIVVVLDTFRSDFFEDAMEKGSLRERIPPGFTYYRNATSLYPSTQFGLQTIVTSRTVASGIRYESWLRENMKSSAPKRLQKLGFDVRVMSIAPHRLGCRFAFPNRCVRPEQVAARDPEVAARRLAASDAHLMFAAGVFRLSPHFLKAQGTQEVTRTYVSCLARACTERRVIRLPALSGSRFSRIGFIGSVCVYTGPPRISHSPSNPSGGAPAQGGTSHDELQSEKVTTRTPGLGSVAAREGNVPASRAR